MAGTLRRLTAGSAVLITALFGVVACGSGSSSTTASTQGSRAVSGGGATQSSSLPAAIRSAGVLRVGTNVPFVPMEQYGPDGKTFQGIDLDLITAVAGKLGLKVQIANANWDGLIPALNAGRYDVLAASFGDFVERQKVVDIVDMLKGGVSGITKAGNAAKYTDASTLCGKDVGVESGSATVQIAKTLSATCQKDGKAAIGQHVFPTDGGAVVALQSGRVDVVLDDTVVAQHLAATQSNRYAYVLPGLGSPFYYAFVVSKKDPALSKAIEGAVNALIADGAYAKICAKYGITGASLVTSATVDAGTTSVNSA